MPTVQLTDLTTPPTLILRADATVEMGSGHVVRSVALGQRWEAMGGRALLATATAARQDLVTIPVPRSHPASDDLDAMRSVIAAHPRAWVSCDGYHLDAAYCAAIRDAGARLLVIDDVGHAAASPTDVLLNQNIGAEQLGYPPRPDVLRLFGPRYALLRPAFDVWAGWRRPIPDHARRVLVTMGGSDPCQQTQRVMRVIRILRGVDGPLDVAIVVGRHNPDVRTIRDEAVGSDAARFTVHVDVDRMPELMAASDLVISAAGSTVWELCHMGAPMLLVSVAANQRAIGEGLARQGAAVYLGGCDSISDAALRDAIVGCLGDLPLRERLSLAARGVVDGRGTRRVCRVLRGEPEEMD